MSTFIFPAGKHSRKTLTSRIKPTLIPKHLFHLIRGATDAAEGLELFVKLLRELEPDNSAELQSSPGFLAFDAHVGDTACQLRACMLLEIVNRYRQLCPKAIELQRIQACIDRLKEVINNSRSFCQDLLGLKWHVAPIEALDALGMSKHGMTMEEILRKIGWTDVTVSSPLQEYQSPLTLESHTSSVSSRSSSQNRLSEQSTDTSLSSATSATSTSRQYICMPVSEKGNVQLSFSDATSNYWEPWDWHQVVYFLVYSYTLSKYKRFVIRAQVYGANIDPVQAFRASNDLTNGNFDHPYQKPNKRQIEEEFRVLQSYVSDLSCSWLSSVARMFCPDRHLMSRLLDSSKRISAKGIASVSSYLGYIAVRELWAQTSTPIMIVSRMFCGKGFHANIFKANLQVLDYRNDDHVDSVIRPNISWKLTHVTGNDLKGLRKSMRPHVVICGNSLNGETADYLERLPTTYAHQDDDCPDNIAHCKGLVHSDQDQVVLSIFADHRHYAFDLTGEEGKIGEEAVVQQIMNELTPNLSQSWRKSKDEARDLGTGPSLRLFMWQHVSLESPARFLRLVESIDQPWLISAPVPVS